MLFWLDKLCVLPTREEVDDTTVLRIIMRITSYLCMVPWEPDNTVGLWYGIYVIIFCALEACAAILLFPENNRMIKATSMGNQATYLKNGETFLDVAFNVVCHLGTNRFKAGLTKYFECITCLDQVLTDREGVGGVREIIIGEIVFQSFLISLLVITAKVNSFVNGYTVYLLSIAYAERILFNSCFVGSIELITRRFRKLQIRIRRYFLRHWDYQKYNSWNCIISNAKQQNWKPSLELRDLQLSCDLLDRCSRHIDEVYGLPMLIFFSTAFLEILNVVTSLLTNASTDNPKSGLKVVAPFLAQCCLYIVCVIRASSACERLERRHLSLLGTLNAIQTHVTVDDPRYESVVYLSNFIRNSPPQISACGFFRINRQILPVFLSGLISYVIVVMQFHAASSE